MIQLRPYQRDAGDAVYRYLREKAGKGTRWPDAARAGLHRRAKAFADLLCKVERELGR